MELGEILFSFCDFLFFLITVIGLSVLLDLVILALFILFYLKPIFEMGIQSFKAYSVIIGGGGVIKMSLEETFVQLVVFKAYFDALQWLFNRFDIYHAS